MEHNKIKSILMKSISLQQVNITGDHNHIEIIAIGKIFLGMNNVKRQQTIYVPLMKYFANQEIHAVSIKTFTPIEWDKKNNI
ncbi:Acid stress protein IbaG [Buchnera aphidicola (Eriosoma lanigerum)]|uniref:BolA family protein n=1 Tax=Buchnera aphidicola TaxID=9 RepID=UPI0034642120